MKSSDIPVERLAEVTARLDVGESRAAVLAELGIGMEEFRIAQEQWLAAIGHQVLRGDFKLQRQYSGEYLVQLELARRRLGTTPARDREDGGVGGAPAVTEPPLAKRVGVEPPPAGQARAPMHYPPEATLPHGQDPSAEHRFATAGREEALPPIVEPPPAVPPPPAVLPAGLGRPSSGPALAPPAVIDPPPVVPAISEPSGEPARRVPGPDNAEPPMVVRRVMSVGSLPGPNPAATPPRRLDDSNEPPPARSPRNDDVSPPLRTFFQPDEVPLASGSASISEPTVVPSLQGDPTTPGLGGPTPQPAKPGAGSFANTGFQMSPFAGSDATAAPTPPPPVAPPTHPPPARPAMPSVKPLPDSLPSFGGNSFGSPPAAGHYAVPGARPPATAERAPSPLGGAGYFPAGQRAQPFGGSSGLVSPLGGPGSATPHGSPPPQPSPTAFAAELSLEQIACMVAEMDLDPSREAAVLSSNGVDAATFQTQKHKLELQMAGDESQLQRFEQLRGYYRAILSSR